MCAARYSKRHASFNSPREVPLPSPTADRPVNPFSLITTAPTQLASSSKAQDAFESQLPSPSAVLQENDLRSSPGSSRPRSPLPRSFLQSDPPRRMHTKDVSSPPTSPLLAARPPLSRSNSSFAQPEPHCPPPDLPHMSTAWLERTSSASLPLPSQIPFHALPRMTSSSHLLMRPPTPASDLGSDSRAPRQQSPPSSSTEVASPPRSPDRSAFRCPSVDEASSTSSSSSGSGDSGATSSSSLNTENSSVLSDKLSPDPSLTAGPSASPSPNPRPISPFRAPQPPPQPRRSPVFDFSTAMGRFMTPHSPPSFQPPDPPVILPAEIGDDTTQSVSRPHAPHFPFLSHAPPPPDCWIEVETTLSEYKLHVRLPGFSREGITLATKRRRILHVVADRWDNGGGHFERRISFGYDADLVQVRAEFDGTMLRIVVPRRISPVTLLHGRT
ncbi:hypothetical protein CVT26_003727 [Gymnopilus dilepis]|uniref:SHSP domain-containing protein n=1 Tax=Gymnopilus dilepis TaxID=231916 RepID=A0A409YXE8_9AGAR|nr:hypothetical protein CVT26_003727 [Gymnopilus dilepis]